jgi:hypothetical protein
MADESHLFLIRACFKERFFILLVSLMGLMVISPMSEEFIILKLLLDIFVSIVFICSIYAVSNKKIVVCISFALALPMFISMWVPVSAKPPSLVLTGDLFGILFMAFIVFEILSFIFKERDISPNIIYASIVAYLLLAVMWAFIYKVIETLQPGSFSASQKIVGEGRSLFSYYSFVTITTLGYGDITPVKGAARAFSMLEAVVGQIYLVVLVARLVGINIAQTINKEE